MKAFVITVFSDDYSVRSARQTIATARHMTDDLHIEMIKAVTPEDLTNEKYGYPLEGQTATFAGMTLEGYRASDHRKIMACSLSHLKLWELCIELDEPIMILEHDAVFTRKFRPTKILNKIENGDIVMINDPRGATRRSQIYHSNILNKDFGIHPIDGVNLPEEKNPDGLAGNSAYVITPDAAFKASVLQRKDNLWPNDALLCKQNFPKRLKSYYPYITRVEQKRSTTTG